MMNAIPDVLDSGNDFITRLGIHSETKYKPNYTFDQSLKLQSKFHKLIPGGSHTFAKGNDQFPEFITPYIVKGKGYRLWDVDGNEFIEYGMGLAKCCVRSCLQTFNQRRN